MRRLVVLTSQSEWEVGGEGDGPLTARTAQARAHSHRGSGDLPPLVVGSTVLFLSRGGREVYELSYDGPSQTWADRDLTVGAAHLLEGHSIVDWCYQAHPESVIWCVRDDGVLLSLTYVRELGLAAWARHTTEGTVRRVVAVPEGKTDVVYLAVSRALAGEPRVALERMEDRGRVTDPAQARFLDCSSLAWGATPPEQTQHDITNGFTRTDVGPVRLRLAFAEGEYEIESSFYEFSAAWVGRKIAFLAGAVGQSAWIAFQVTGYIAEHRMTVELSGTGNPTPFLDQWVDDEHWIALLDEVSGFSRFAGQTVTVYADGEAYEAEVSATGTLSLRAHAGWVLVGLPYDAELERTPTRDSGCGSSRCAWWDWTSRAAAIRLSATRCSG